jgi:hypothetical protein
MSFSRLALLALVLAGVAASPAAAVPQCVTMKFVDSSGVVIPTPKPIYGIMLGGRPAPEGDAPAGATPQAGAPVPCPPEIIQHTQELFEQSCVSEDRRVKAARENKVDRKIIDKGCADIIAAMAPER